MKVREVENAARTVSDLPLEVKTQLSEGEIAIAKKKN